MQKRRDLEAAEPGAHPLTCMGLSHRKADLELSFPLPTCYFKTCPPSLPQQNEIQLIQLKQFWEQLLKAFNAR